MPILLKHLWQETVKCCVSFKYIILVGKIVSLPDELKKPRNQKPSKTSI